MDNHPGVAYSKLSTSEAPNAPAPGQPPDVAGTMGQAQDALEVAHQAQDMQGQAEDAIKMAQQAQDMQVRCYSAFLLSPNRPYMSLTF